MQSSINQYLFMIQPVIQANFYQFRWKRKTDLTEFSVQREKLDGMAIKLSADNIEDKSQAVILYEVVDKETGIVLQKVKKILENYEVENFLRLSLTL